MVEAAIRNESVATLAPLVVDYLEGRRRRGGLARPGMGAQKALRLGRRGLSRKNISLTAIEAIMHKIEHMCARTGALHALMRG